MRRAATRVGQVGWTAIHFLPGANTNGSKRTVYVDGMRWPAGDALIKPL
jgi:hypothetical protein